MSAVDARKKPEGRYHHGDLRNALLASALEIVEQSGFDALTLRAVALRLGVSHAAPVYHFPTKADLVGALAEEGFRLFADALESAAHGERTDRLMRVGRAYLEFARCHPNHYSIMFGPELSAILVPTPGFLAESNRALGVLIETSGDRPSPFPLGERALFVWSVVP